MCDRCFVPAAQFPKFPVPLQIWPVKHVCVGDKGLQVPVVDAGTNRFLYIQTHKGVQTII